MKRITPLIIEELLFFAVMLFLWQVYFRARVSIAEFILALFAIGLGILFARQICCTRFKSNRSTVFFWLTDGFIVLLLMLIFCITFSCLAVLAGQSLDWQLIITLSTLYADGFILIDRTISSMIDRAAPRTAEQDDEADDDDIFQK